MWAIYRPGDNSYTKRPGPPSNLFDLLYKPYFLLQILDSSERATSSSNTGLIVGLVIAGIVILCIIVVLVVCFYKRRAAPG